MKIGISISRWTALVINNDENDIRCDAGQHKVSGKWAGLLNQYRDGFFHTILISTQDIFPDKESAIADVESTLQQIRAMTVAEILAPAPEETPANPPNLA